MNLFELISLIVLSVTYVAVFAVSLYFFIRASKRNKQAGVKSKNVFVRLWNYFTTYEKCWLLVLFTAGITISIIFPDEEGWFLQAVSIITLLGGCTCELLLSKQSKWAFIVSFFFYDLTQLVLYIANGYYVSALFEILFWIPILFVSFATWNKKPDSEDSNLTQVKGINWKRDLLMFLGVLAVSLLTGAIFTGVGGFFEGMSEYWYIDALANTFSVLNGLFLVFRFREQWLPWYGVMICETIMWIIAGNWVMLILQVGYLTNTTYGLIKWEKYIKKHNKEENTEETKEDVSETEEKTIAEETPAVTE